MTREGVIKTAAVFSFILISSSCNFFSLSIPDYIDKYTNSAAAEKCVFTRGIILTNSGDAVYIKPGEEVSTEMELTLRNPRNYNLLAVPAYLAESGWKNFSYQDMTNRSLFTDPDITGELNVEFRNPDRIRVRLSDAVPGKRYKIRIMLFEAETQRPMDPFTLPELICSDFPLNITGIRMTPGANRKGLKIYWKQLLKNDARDADRLTISVTGLGNTETYSRTLNQPIRQWSGWKTADNKTINFAAGEYSTTIGGTIPLTRGTTYLATLTFTNQDGLSREPVYVSYTHPNANPAYLYVSPGGSGTKDGSSWDDAMDDVQQAIVTATDLLRTPKKPMYF